MNSDELSNNILKNGFCSGCGACAAVENSDFQMIFTRDGRYESEKKVNQVSLSNIDYAKICPFATTYNEDKIAKDLFSTVSDIEHNSYEGYVLKRYAGHASSPFHVQGSSGGLTTWLLSKLLQEKIVESVVHVRPNRSSSGPLYAYSVSYDLDGLTSGASSKYYPVQMSDVLKKVRDEGEKCALVGVPCFIKAVNLLQKDDDKLKQLIKIKIGLVCGHLKSDYFARSYAMELGINYDNVTAVNFREKLPGRTANDYGAKLTYMTDYGIEERVVPTKELSTTNWGLGCFKYKACEYCDDVLAETADVTFGDAWLPRYAKDYLGTNIVIIRNPLIQQIFEKYSKEVTLESITADDVYQSQAGGFRHRREGLAYRLYLLKDSDNYVPMKRVEPSDALPRKRKHIIAYRETLRSKSFESFEAAQAADDFEVFNEQMAPYLKEYRKLNERSIFYKALRKVYRGLRKAFEKS